MTKWYVYGNQIDEPLAVSASASDASYIKYYLLDHLNSPVVLFDRSGTVNERYEYDAYGSCKIMYDNYSEKPIANWAQGSNPILFTGRNVDYLDGGSLKLQYNRNRYYSQDMGRWLTKDPLGTNPSGQLNNPFKINSQYSNGTNLYEYLNDNPLIYVDAYGLELNIFEIIEPHFEWTMSSDNKCRPTGSGYGHIEFKTMRWLRYFSDKEIKYTVTGSIGYTTEKEKDCRSKYDSWTWDPSSYVNVTPWPPSISLWVGGASSTKDIEAYVSEQQGFYGDSVLNFGLKQSGSVQAYLNIRRWTGCSCQLIRITGNLEVSIKSNLAPGVAVAGAFAVISAPEAIAAVGPFAKGLAEGLAKYAPSSACSGGTCR